jgi:hypothetical protein
VILAAAVLLLVAVGLLVAGLVQGSSTLQWASFAASALAALLLVVSEVRQRRAERQRTPAESGGAHRSAPVTAATAPPPVLPRHDAAAETDHGEPLRRVFPPPVPPSSPSIPRVAGPPSGSGLGDLAGPTGGPPSDGAGLRAQLGPRSAEGPVVPVPGEPPVEDVEFTDQLMVLDLTDEVLVIDEHPRYHLPRCPHVSGLETIPLPLTEARTDGFTPCATCAPDHHLAQRERARRAG